MAWLRRRRRILKWVGLVMSLLIVLVWSISLGWRVDLQRTDRTPDTQGNYCAIRAYVGNGGFGCYRSVPFQLDNKQETRWWACCHRRFSKPIWLPSIPYLSWDGWNVWLPLWIPFLLVTVPTAILWLRSRGRIPPGNCRKCGYNLTGNVSGLCPECGESAR